ncbi:MAG: glycosyltransferase [Acidobacteria bacterium]|nr:glycosyltransferase [Acidobacteriota bacterium]
MADPIRVLELRSVRGTGGGPEKTILLGTKRTDPSRFAITVCYLRDERDEAFKIDNRARPLGIDYVEVFERHSLDWRIWPQLRRLVRHRSIEIIHAHDYKTNLLALLLRRAEGVIPLSTVHGWSGYSSRERWLYYPADKRILARYPRLIAVSGKIRDELVQAGARPHRITIVLNGIDPTLFRRDRAQESTVRSEYGATRDDIVLGSIGRLEPEKRFDLLIEAFARLVANRAHLKLLIAGEGSVRPQLESAITQLGLGGSCRLLGQVSNVAKVHHAFDVYVQSSDREGTPNAVLEAMAMETPIVATDVGGTVEIARDEVDALIVPPRNVCALQSAIERAISDPTATAARVAAARKRIEGPLSFETRMKTVEGIYEALMARRAGGAA